MLFQLPSLHQSEDWKLKGTKKKGLRFLSVCLIGACEAVVVPWHYNHIHCRTISENDRDCLFNTTIMYK